MIIIGAKGHAKEILDVLESKGKMPALTFFDNVSDDLPPTLFGVFPIITKESEIKAVFQENSSFILGTGGVMVRHYLCSKMEQLGGTVVSVIADSAEIGKYNVSLGEGVNIMHKVLISSGVVVGKGTLINANSLIHHDVSIGVFCEISPGVIITGNVKIGNNTYIGSGAILLPKLTIGSNVTIGAGAVVTSDVLDNDVVVGIPAKSVKNKN